MVLPPLERFYEALGDEQRRRFNAMNASIEGVRSPRDMAAMCSQQAGTFIDLPAQRIEQVVQPTAQQQSAFNDLRKQRRKWATNCNRPVRLRYRNQWRGSKRSKRG
jgi:hypothetical protein